MQYVRGEAPHTNPSAGKVTLTSGAPIKKGAEIFISYGERPNEELLYSHGFCVRDNPMDDVALVLDLTPTPTLTLTLAPALPPSLTLTLSPSLIRWVA